MSKKNKQKAKANIKTETPALSAPAPLEPSRTLGLMVLLISIIFTAVLLTRESIETRNLQSSGDQIDAPSNSLAGFDSSAWFLPADENWGFVEILAGTFTMGSNPAIDSMAYGNEQWSRRQRQGTVDLPTYYISRYETTVAQYKAYLLDTEQTSEALNLEAAGNFPVAGITWPEALAYGRWLEEKIRSSDGTPADLKRFLESGGHLTLPTEAEWEKAARGTDNRVFPWGSRVRTDVANYNSPAPLGVGALPCPACSYGLSDMSGNVWELTRSPLQDYPYTTEDDGEDLAGEALWVMRGGSYADQVNNVRAAVRGGVDPSVRNLTIGFRLVMSKL